MTASSSLTRCPYWNFEPLFKAKSGSTQLSFSVTSSQIRTSTASTLDQMQMAAGSPRNRRTRRGQVRCGPSRPVCVCHPCGPWSLSSWIPVSGRIREARFLCLLHRRGLEALKNRNNFLSGDYFLWAPEGGSGGGRSSHRRECNDQAPQMSRAVSSFLK